MASVNFLKCKGGAAKAMMRHSEKEERLKHEHANPDLDKDCTCLNSSRYGLSYDEMCNKYDRRIADLDATTNTNFRSDRVTMFSLEFTVPEGVPPWQENEFLARVEDLIADRYGERNIIDSERHMDEKHAYLDHGEEKMSRAHAHVFVVPELNGKLDGKRFSSRAQMQGLNRDIEAMAIREYGVHFMTGKDARKQTVEELKHDSAVEAHRLELEALKGQKNAFEAQWEQEQHEHDELIAVRKAAEAAQEERIAARQAELAEQEARLVKQERALEGRVLTLEEVEKLSPTRLWSAEDKRNLQKTALKASQAIEEAKSYRQELKGLKKANKGLKTKLEEEYTPRTDLEWTQATLQATQERVHSLEREIKTYQRTLEEHGLYEPEQSRTLRFR